MTEERQTYATINGVKYDTVIDRHGTQRFPENRVVSRMMEWAARAGYDLNRLWIDYQSGGFTREEMRQFYMLIGYSVCGLDECFGPNSSNHTDLKYDERGDAIGGYDEIDSSCWSPK